MKDKQFDFEAFKEQAKEALKAGKGLLGEEGAFTPLLKSFLEEVLNGELDDHIAEKEAPNRKNGKGKFHWYQPHKCKFYASRPTRVKF